jgi:hypothetical protein
MRLIGLLLIFTFGSTGLAGGVSGGGGGTKPSERIDLKDLKSIISMARLDSLFFYLRLYPFNAKPEAWNATEAQLFGGKRAINDLIFSTSFLIKMNGDCLDGLGRSVDASVDPHFPNRICLSSRRLIKKLSKDSAYTQMAGLLTHEYSHLVGFGEKEAEKFQRDHLAGMKKNSMTAVDRLGRLNSEVRDLILSMQDLQSRIDELSFDILGARIENWLMQTGRISNLTNEIPHIVNTPEAAGLFLSYETQALAMITTGGMLSSDLRNRQALEQLAAILFGTKDEFSILEESKSNPALDLRYVIDLRVKRVHTKDDLKEQLSSVIAGFERYAQYLRTLSHLTYQPLRLE